MFHPCLGKDNYSDSQHQGNCRHRQPAFDEVYTGKNNKAMENHHFLIGKSSINIYRWVIVLFFSEPC
jgi:hypothetical protein